MTRSQRLVTKVDFATVPTQDFERAAQFYGEVLGLPCSVRYGRIPMDFVPSKNPFALHVEDVEAARSELESRGVSFLRDTLDSGVCYMAPFEDPDGNLLMLHHRYAPRD